MAKQQKAKNRKMQVRKKGKVKPVVKEPPPLSPDDQAASDLMNKLLELREFDKAADLVLQSESTHLPVEPLAMALLEAEKFNTLTELAEAKKLPVGVIDWVMRTLYTSNHFADTEKFAKTIGQRQKRLDDVWWSRYWQWAIENCPGVAKRLITEPVKIKPNEEMLIALARKLLPRDWTDSSFDLDGFWLDWSREFPRLTAWLLERAIDVHQLHEYSGDGVSFSDIESFLLHHSIEIELRTRVMMMLWERGYDLFVLVSRIGPLDWGMIDLLVRAKLKAETGDDYYGDWWRLVRQFSDKLTKETVELARQVAWENMRKGGLGHILKSGPLQADEFPVVLNALLKCCDWSEIAKLYADRQEIPRSIVNDVVQIYAKDVDVDGFFEAIGELYQRPPKADELHWFRVAIQASRSKKS